MRPSQTLKPFPYLALIACILYWIYLASTAQPILVHDALVYEHLGSVINKHGWVEYLKTGPNREPLYPLLISLSMRLADGLSVSYLSIQIFFQFVILFLSSLLILRILDRLNVRTFLKTCAVIYFGFSPAIINSACSLFSEILTYPFILLFILISANIFESIKTDKTKQVIIQTISLGFVLVSLTLIKAVFEVVISLILLFYLFWIIQTFIKKEKRLSKSLALSLIVLFLTSSTAIFLYKEANQKFNGHFALTDRGAWALYGNIARRMEPLNKDQIQEALAYIPGENFCKNVRGENNCGFWSWKISDQLGADKHHELEKQNLPANQLDQKLITLAFGQMVEHPFQAVSLTFVEGSKMMFWESTQIGFVIYPTWLMKIYNGWLLKYGLSFGMALLTLLAVLYLIVFTLKQRNDKSQPLLGPMVVVILTFIAIHSIFYILPRYAFPLAPLYLVAIAFVLDRYFTTHFPLSS